MSADVPMTSDLQTAYAFCEAELRAGDYERWVSTLFAPASARPHLQALYAFNLDIARVREIVSEPMLGEIRYQWWRDTLGGQGHGDVHANPVAAAVLDTLTTFKLPASALLNLIAARTFDLYDDPMPRVGDLEGYCGETSSVLMRLAALILAEGQEPKGADALGHGGVAYAITGLLRALPWHTARGQVYVPADLLARHGISRETWLKRPASPQAQAVLTEMRALAQHHFDAALKALPDLAPVSRAALMPLAVVPPALRHLAHQDATPFAAQPLPQWRVLWALWRFSKRL